MYQVLARKYRPKNFHELIGQNHVSMALINAIEQQRLHHAYLFTGTRGVGKTTIARILAKCLNCETGTTSEPCGVCSTCVAIDAGRFIDLIEIDAASRTKVEDTRELLDNVPYAPTQGRYKVYLIDEVHMLSTHSFNALLKTLEEPPEHVKFLLATTDPQKLPITIISRCLQFVLRPSPQPQLAEYLAFILQQEQITFTTDALWQIASSARGSFRDALSLTDQAIAFGNGKIEQDTVKQMLGLIDQADIVGLFTAIVQHHTAQVGQAIHQLREQVVDAKAVFDSLAEMLHQLALLQVLPEFDLQLDTQQTQARQALAKLIPADLLQLYYEIVTQSREKIGLANTPLQALEMCILRMMAFRPLGQNEFVPSQTMDLSTIQVIENPIEIPHHSNSLRTVEQITHDVDVVIENAEKVLSPQDSLIMSEKEVMADLLKTQTDDNQPEALSTNHTVALPETSDLTNTQTIDNVRDKSQISQNKALSADLDDSHTPVAITELNNDNTNQTLNSFDNAQQISQNDALKYTQLGVLPNEIQANQSLSETSTSSKNGYLNEITPFQLLEPQPQDLTGDWTPHKWDYWLYRAYQQKQIDNDEYAFAKKGVMVGKINGKGEFITNSHNHALTGIFDSLVKKLTAQLPNSQVQVTQYRSEVHSDLLQIVPESLQKHRHHQAIDLATEQLNQLPVVQALVTQHAHLTQVTLLHE